MNSLTSFLIEPPCHAQQSRQNIHITSEAIKTFQQTLFLLSDKHQHSIANILTSCFIPVEQKFLSLKYELIK